MILPASSLGKIVWQPVDPHTGQPFTWRLSLLRLALETFLLLFRPACFAEEAAEHAFRTELLTNEQLRQARPNGRMTYEDRERLLAQSAAAASELRRAILRSLGLIAIVLIAAWVTVLVAKRTGTIAEPLPGVLRVASAGLLAWSVLGRLGWEIQTIKDRTIPEQINRSGGVLFTSSACTSRLFQS